MQKITHFALLTTFVFLFSSAMAHHPDDSPEAEITDAEIEFSNPGLLPDHPFYFAKKIKERVQLFFAFDSEDKARLHLNFAKARVAEAKALVEKNKTDEAGRTIEDFNRELERLEASSKGIGRNVSALVKETEDVLEKSRSVLELVWAKVPDQAKPVIESAINNTIEKKLRIKIEIGDRQEETEVETEIEEEIGRSEEIRQQIKDKIQEKLKAREERIKERQEPEICIQVITPARNPVTGECKEYPTPCDVPEGWEKVDSCGESDIIV